MSLRLRVFAGLALLLALTVAAAWSLTGGAILRPLIGMDKLEITDDALVLSVDNDFLAAGSYVSGGIVWDLQAIRARLRAMNLDW